MARGIMFHACLNPADIRMMDASDFSDCTDLLKVDYVEDQSMHQANYQLGILKRTLEESGFHIRDNKGVPDHDAAFVLDASANTIQTCKERWFQSRLAELKNSIAALSLSDFASNGSTVLDLQHLIEDTYGDMVYMGHDNGITTTMTLDQFIRSLEQDKLYYFSDRTVLLN